MFEELQESIIAGDKEKATSLTKEFLEQGTEPKKVLREGLVAGMDVVGQRFKSYEMWLPEVILSAKAMKASTELMKPYWEQAGGGESLGKIVIATVEGDVHDIGKNLVSMMLEAAGFDVADLGVNVKIQEIVDEANKENADIVALSALLTQTMLAMKPAINAIRGSGSKAKVIVGGSPITQEYAKEVKSDGFAPDALRAINLAKTLLGKA